MFNLNDYLAQATQGQMGGVQQQQPPVQQPQQFDPRILEAMGLSQGYDAEDERLQRQRAQVDALRRQQPITSPKSGGAWAQGAANVINAGMAAYKDRKTDKAQRIADQQRSQGMRDFSTMYRGAEGKQADGSMRVPFSPMRRY